MIASADKVRKLTRGEAPSAAEIPLGALVGPDACKLRGKSAYCATWRIAGVPFETSTPQVIAGKLEHLAAVYRNLGGGELSYWYHRTARIVQADLSNEAFSGFAQAINERYAHWQSQRGYSLFEIHLTLVYHPALPRARKMIFRRQDTELRQLLDEQRAEQARFAEICQQAELLLRDFGPRRLGVVTRRGREISELASFYGFLVNGVWREQPLYPAPLCHSLPNAYLHFGDLNGRLEINAGGEKRFVALLDVVDYPPEGLAGDFDALLGLGVEFIETHSFRTFDRAGGLGELQRMFNQMVSGEEASRAELEAMEAAIEEVRDGRIVAGEYHFSLALFGNSLAEVQQAAGAVRREVPSYRIEDVRLVPEGAWFAQLPGNWAYRPRLGIMTSRNFAALAPLHSHPTGKAAGNPWGEAVAILRGSGNQPFAFNFHAAAEGMDRLDAKDPGNTVVFGVTGSGKTAFVMFLLAQAQRFCPRILFFDKDRGAEIAIRAFGGSYTVFKAGEYTGLNPFQWPDAPRTRELCRKVVAACVRRGAGELAATEELAISIAVDSVFQSLPHAQRRLSAVDQFLPAAGDDNRITKALSKWIHDGYAAWVLDSPEDRLHLERSRIYGIDYTVFLDNEEIREPVMLVLMALRDALIDGTPFISVMDEFWKALGSKQLADDEKNKQKTGRKEGMISVLMSQSVSDALDHEHARTLVEQTVTKCFLPNPDASRGDYIDALGLSEREFELVKGFGQYSRKVLIRQAGGSVVADVDLSGLGDQMLALSGSLDNVRLLDDIRAQHGDDPQVWFPLLADAVQERRRKAA